MTISSRTREGYPNRCPVCGQEVTIEPSRPSGDSPCPNCGHLLSLEQGRSVPDAVATALRRRILKAGVVLLLITLILALFLFGAPRLSKVELTVILALAAVLFGPRLFQAFNRAGGLWPFRRR